MAIEWSRYPTRPTRLHTGARVAIVTPCWGGPAVFPERYATGKRQLVEAFGLQVVEMSHVHADADWLDRNPRARADDLMAAFADPGIEGIVAAIGGDDAVRLIPYLDLGVISANPKVFLGYSDTTVIGFGCLKAGIVSFYGPTIMSGFAENGGLHAHMVSSLKRVLFTASPAGTVEPSREGWTVERLDWGDPRNQSVRRRLSPSSGPRLLRGEGTARGHLIGGCADVLETLKGTAWWPPLDYWRGALLFLETSEEAPPPALLARWLRNYAAQGILQVLGGILFGRPGGHILSVAEHASYDAAVLRALDEANLARLPVFANLDFGHTDPIFTLPYGVQAEMDCGRVELRIVDAAVSSPAPSLPLAPAGEAAG